MSAAEGLAELQAFLAQEKLSAVTKDAQQVFTLEHTESIGQALKALAKRKVLSAPLVVSPGLEDARESGDEPAAPALLGWIDVFDLLKGLLTHLKDKHKKLPTNMLLLMGELESEGKHYAGKTLVTLHGTEDRGLIYQGDISASLMDTIKTIFLSGAGTGAKVIHRLALFDASGTITHVVSQLDFIRFLASHEEKLGQLADASVQSLGLVSGRPVVSVEPNVPTVLAFEKMLLAGVSAAAVVSDKGKIIANLSVSDLRCIQPEHLGVLALPVAEFLALLHQTSYLGYSQRSSDHAEHSFFAGSPRSFGRGAGMRPMVPSGDGRPAEAPPSGEDDAVRLITAKRDSTFADVLHLLSDNHVHRVYVVDPAATPEVVGVLTPTDILRFVAGLPPPSTGHAGAHH